MWDGIWDVNILKAQSKKDERNDYIIAAIQ